MARFEDGAALLTCRFGAEFVVGPTLGSSDWAAPLSGLA